MQLKKIYRNNKNSVMFVVLTEIFKCDEKGEPIIVRAESCVNGYKRKIHVRDIHDGPYESGWSLVTSAK